MIYVVATLTIKPGTNADLLEAAKPCIEGTRNEPGCISYDLNQSQTDKNTMVFVERWESRDALQSHFTAPHMAVWREKGAQYIVGRKVEIIHPEKIETL